MSQNIRRRPRVTAAKIVSTLAIAISAPLLVGCGKDGDSLAADVTRALQSQRGVTATDVTCEDFKPAKGVIVDCEATVNGRRTGLRVTFDDERHFTVDPQDPGH
ncbi:DUF4333 domain-containing protein [Kribbella sp. CA-245084]|uniref:DUF4333 domain-containing protein n=1 Tax=Kribbella sp. CA-245084 TaxID=3239940 RepID=UPI003D8B68E0